MGEAIPQPGNVQRSRLSPSSPAGGSRHAGLRPGNRLTCRTPDHAVACKASLMQVARQDIRQLTDLRSRGLRPGSAPPPLASMAAGKERPGRRPYAQPKPAGLSARWPETPVEKIPERLASDDIKQRRAPPAFGGTLRCDPDLTAIMSRRQAPCRCGHFLPKLSNSPFRAPPRKASHSSGVNRRTGPSGSLLLRRPIVLPGRLATSTQLPLEKLSELLTQKGPEPGRSGEFPSVGLPTMYLTDCRILSQRCTECTLSIT